MSFLLSRFCPTPFWSTPSVVVVVVFQQNTDHHHHNHPTTTNNDNINTDCIYPYPKGSAFLFSIVAAPSFGILLVISLQFTIGDGRFRGTTVESQHTKLYQKLMGNSSTFSDEEKMVHLLRSEATIISELRQK
jgi:hypothetical protein